jgi:hypothetical protein
MWPPVPLPSAEIAPFDGKLYWKKILGLFDYFKVPESLKYTK